MTRGPPNWASTQGHDPIDDLPIDQAAPPCRRASIPRPRTGRSQPPPPPRSDPLSEADRTSLTATSSLSDHRIGARAPAKMQPPRATSPPFPWAPRGYGYPTAASSSPPGIYRSVPRESAPHTVPHNFPNGETTHAS
ncbi:hypothetical protein DAI22_05g154800 [Oryza sativa Japonica Group]|nr:hypothetical protein DAI22_05g154800 [Oryza sativa Japonica Group]